jgi:hypothetical protein
MLASWPVTVGRSRCFVTRTQPPAHTQSRALSWPAEILIGAISRGCSMSDAAPLALTTRPAKSGLWLASSQQSCCCVLPAGCRPLAAAALAKCSAKEWLRASWMDLANPPKQCHVAPANGRIWFHWLAGTFWAPRTTKTSAATGL